MGNLTPFLFARNIASVEIRFTIKVPDKVDAAPVLLPPIFNIPSPEGTQLSIIISARSNNFFLLPCLEGYFFDCSMEVIPITFNPFFFCQHCNFNRHGVPARV